MHAHRHAWAMKLLGRLSRLPLKKAPWRQGTRPLGVTHHVRRPRGEKEAITKSLGLKKAPLCFLHQCDKTLYCLWQRYAGIIKSKLCINKGSQ